MQAALLYLSAPGKLAGLDKKLSRSLEEDVMSSSPLELSKSPVGPLAESTRWASVCKRCSVAPGGERGGLQSFQIPAALTVHCYTWHAQWARVWNLH